jgi:hypothetical protein
MDLWRELYPDMFVKVETKGNGKGKKSVVKADNYKRSAAAMEAGQAAGRAARIVQPGEKLSNTQRSIDA